MNLNIKALYAMISVALSSFDISDNTEMLSNGAIVGDLFVNGVEVMRSRSVSQKTYQEMCVMQPCGKKEEAHFQQYINLNIDMKKLSRLFCFRVENISAAIINETNRN